MLKSPWQVVGVSATGFDHHVDGKPCQDAHAFEVTPSGWLVGAVSDGAGSAPRSEFGARTFCSGVVRYLVTRLEGLEPSKRLRLTDTDGRVWVEDAIDMLRTSLRNLKENDSERLDQFHTTLLGVIAGPEGGIFFHVGDGACFAARSDDLSKSVVSEPENGQYSNETYFVTQENWREHLRLSLFGPEYDLIALMTDGVTPFAMTQGVRGPFPGFFEPLSHYLESNSREEGERAINTYFQDDRVRAITGDDKTLIWAIRRDQRGVLSEDNEI